MLLAVDTSTAQMGLAAYDGAQVLAEMTWTNRKFHTVELAPSIAGLLARCGLTMEAVSALGVAIGPGSFTSLRVGLSFAKGLALARRLPLIGIPTLDVVAAAQPLSELPLVATLQAGRGRLAVGWYAAVENGWQAQGPARVETVDSLAEQIQDPTIVCGELSAEERQRLARKRVNVVLMTAANSVRRPAILAELAWARWQAGQTDDLASLAPIYLHVAEPIPG
ncbi:MAG: tRNA (adenosine(37)-N6)-threonylcarbamoyltransferase complex dimerization subunit type 1 TsaB [Chloroflexi bacterium]|nr:tRNA (adenosine(37)-N6)-threonylcarbamoyltransferase complex dimerization subunit type 1 TsaB [Chloroflexota bacterium]